MKLQDLRTLASQEQLSYLLHGSRKTISSFYNKKNNILHLAIYSRRLETLKIVYESLRDCNLHKKFSLHENDRGETPVQLARRLGLVDMVWWLQSPEAKRRENFTPSDFKIFLNNVMGAGIIPKVMWMSYAKGKIDFAQKVELHRGPLSKVAKELSFRWGIEDQGVSVKRTAALTWWIKLYNRYSLVFTSALKKYPWKTFSPFPLSPHHRPEVLLLPQEISKNLNKKANEQKISVFEIIVAVMDKVLQEELLSKKVVSTNLLLQLEEDGESFAALPFKASKNRNLRKKACQLKKNLNWAFILKKSHRLELEFKSFNYIFKFRPWWLAKIISGEKSRFALYFKNDSAPLASVDSSRLVPALQANALTKIVSFIDLRGEELLLTLDVQEQVLRDLAQRREILEKVQKELEVYGQV